MFGCCGRIRAAIGASTPEVHDACFGSGHGQTVGETDQGQCLRGALSISGGKAPPLPTEGVSGARLCLSPASGRMEQGRRNAAAVAREPKLGAGVLARVSRPALSDCAHSTRAGCGCECRTRSSAPLGSTSTCGHARAGAACQLVPEAKAAREGLAGNIHVAADALLAALGRAGLQRRLPEALVRIGWVRTRAVMRCTRLAALLLVRDHK